MSLTKTTENFAAKRGIVLLETEGHLWLFEADQDCEPVCMYTEGDDGWHFRGNVYLPQSAKEELPAWIRDEKHLREVVAFIASEIH